MQCKAFTETICTLQANIRRTYTVCVLILKGRVQDMWMCSEHSCMYFCRATTCYLVQRRIDMLPKALTEDICSLRANVERLAFSAIWEMTQDAQVLGVRFVGCSSTMTQA